MFSSRDIERVATGMVAEFGADAEQAVRDRWSHARTQGLPVTASVWEQVLHCITELAEGDSPVGDFQDAC